MLIIPYHFLFNHLSSSYIELIQLLGYTKFYSGSIPLYTPLIDGFILLLVSPVLSVMPLPVLWDIVYLCPVDLAVWFALPSEM